MTRLLTCIKACMGLFLTLCCLCVVSLPATSQGPAPETTFSDPSQEIWSVERPAINGPGTTWTTRVSTAVNNLPADTTTLHLTTDFLRYDPAKKMWVALFSVDKAVSLPPLPYVYDTGANGLMPHPEKGDKYRVKVHGYYFHGMPRMKTVIASKDGVELIPVR